MDLRVLGTVEAYLHGERLRLGPRRQRFVLAVLALEINRAVPVDRLIELSWPDGAPRTALQTLQISVSKLRSALAGDASVRLDRQGTGYLLRAEPSTADAHRFRALLAQAEGDVDDHSRVDLLTAAFSQ